MAIEWDKYAALINRVRSAIQLESAAIAPQTSHLIEAARELADAVERELDLPRT